MIDESRDYRFYADDMMHPSPLAIQYIWECFCNCYFTPSTLSFLKEWNKIRQGLAHRPFNPESEAYQTFFKSNTVKDRGLKRKITVLRCSKGNKVMSSTIEEITSILGAQRIGTTSSTIDWILTDSRSLCFPEETLFFALKTKRNDGHKYIGSLPERGT